MLVLIAGVLEIDGKEFSWVKMKSWDSLRPLYVEGYPPSPSDALMGDF
jgi:hypothetical protein